jgi:diguanylate cyclase (GGDEF)-like protein
MLKGDKKTFLFSFIAVFLSITLILLISTMTIQAQINRNARIKVDISEQSLIAAEKYFITYKINRLTSDLNFIYDTLEQHFLTEDDYHHIEELWLAYSDARKVFDQIRYLDADGNEIIRVNYAPDGAYITPEDQLQNKKDRYYFQQTIDLDKNQIYISPLDLNMEKGVIQLPIKPVIRLARPFFDLNGVKQGIVILNYSASDILAQIASVASSSSGEVFFLNKDSYWLYNSKASYNEWAFSFNPDSTVNFKNYYPKEWGMISSGGSGTMTTDNGYFCYAAIPFNTISSATDSAFQISSEIDSWYILSHIATTNDSTTYPSSNLIDLAGASLRQNYLIYALAILFSAVLAGFITSSRTKSKEVKFFSEYDVMTNALNRHSGIDKLSDAYKSLSKSNCNMSICFLDINGLKEINDTLGHEAGDELIITVAKTIRSVIRSNDFLVRLGGDEFLIALQGVDEDRAEEVWSRIVSEFDNINNTEHRKYLISVSHGIKTLSCNLNQVLDNVLHQADVKMYDEKRRIKANLQIIRK